MTVEEMVVQKLRKLPAEKRQEVLDFVEFLGGKSEAVPRGGGHQGLHPSLSKPQSAMPPTPAPALAERTQVCGDIIAPAFSEGDWQIEL